MLQSPTLPLASKTPRVRILGSDIAGRVAAIGGEVQHFTVGDEVYGDLSRFGSGGWGGFAEYVCAPEDALVTKPPRMTFEQAAGAAASWATRGAGFLCGRYRLGALFRFIIWV
jgi:NADPH:quinone reductase-like Zn-dependent oxidoreductase